MDGKTYIAIDLKSFYASVECVERGLDPLTTNLVVADESRTEKTICLAVSPALKAYGVPGRPRLFEVAEKVREVNTRRAKAAPGHRLEKAESDDTKVRSNPSLALGYIVAVPRMAHYMETSTRIFNIYTKYVSPEDIHVYSIDEVFIDATRYLKTYKLGAREFAMKLILDVLQTTGITATAGIGTNLYLAKVAMDVMAKHIAPDKNGVRVAELDEMSYRRNLWDHRPLTDFWRVGPGYRQKLEANGMFTMGDVARCSVNDEERLYKLFGINAELLIDHAWGWEPCTIADIKAYKPEANSIGAGQVLQSPYEFEKAKLIVREITEALALELVEKGLVTNKLELTIGYDTESLKNGAEYKGPVTTDRYGRKVPKHAHGTANLERRTSSARLLTDAVTALFDRIVDKRLLVRRVYLTAAHVTGEREAEADAPMEQLDLFANPEAQRQEEEKLQKERRMQEAMLQIKRRYGKNAILKGMSFEEGATGRERNQQVGGHKE